MCMYVYVCVFCPLLPTLILLYHSGALLGLIIPSQGYFLDQNMEPQYVIIR